MAIMLLISNCFNREFKSISSLTLEFLKYLYFLSLGFLYGHPPVLYLLLV